MKKKIVAYTRNDNDGSDMKDILQNISPAEYDNVIAITDYGSANNKERTGLIELINLVTNQEIDEVYITCLHDLTRNSEYFYELVQLMIDNDVRLVSAYGDVDTRDRMFMRTFELHKELNRNEVAKNELR